MKSIQRRSVILFILLLSSLFMAAQVTFITRADREIIEGQPFEVQYILQGTKQFSRFTIPPMADFELVEVYDLPAGQKFNDVLNRIDEVLTRVAVLKPMRKGAAWIPGATVEVNGKSFSSNRVRVTIAAAESDEPAADEVDDASLLGPGDNIDQKVKQNFFLTASISKPVCYVGEPLMAIYKACSRLNARSQVSKRPSFTGFSVIEMVDGYDSEPSVEKIKGENYFVHLVRKVQLFPLQAGKYEIDNAQVESVIQFQKESDNVGTSLNGNSIIRHAVTVSSPTLPVEVRPLPEEGQPAAFSGAVGKYTLEASANTHKIESGEQVILKVVLRGNGNFPLITAPEVALPDGIEKGDVKVTDQLNPYNFPLSGTKTFEYELTIRKEGLLTIPSIPFSFFDPADRKYHTVASNPVDIIVERAKANVIKPVVKNEAPLIPRQYYVFVLIAAAIVGWITYQLIRSGNKKPAPVSEPVVIEPVVTDPFLLVDSDIEAGNMRNALLEIQKILYHTCAHEFGIGSDSLNRARIREALLTAGASTDTADRVHALLSDCEWQLYTPSQDPVEIERIRVESRELVAEMKA